MMVLKLLVVLSVGASLLALAGCSSNYPPLETVSYVDLNRYGGVWYEAARLPNSFQDECTCTSAEYRIIDSATVSVVNTCIKNGEKDQVSGKAFVQPGSGNARLKVQFFWPFRGDYYVIALDEENYSYAVVGTPSRKYLWILSRERELAPEVMERLVAFAQAKGFNTAALIRSGCRQ